MAGYSALEAASLAGHDERGGEPHQEADRQPDGHVFKQEAPPGEVLAAGDELGGKGEDEGQRQPVVQPGLEVQRVADQRGHPRVGHHAGRQHRVGGREQRADQEAFGPGQP